MSYTRIVEDGCYIYPITDKAGIKVELFPEELDFIPDSILDVILYKMSDKEIQERKMHGKEIIELLKLDKYEEASSNKKDFFEWRKEKCL